MNRALIVAFALVGGIGATGCRGNISSEPPVHILHDDMVRQQKYKPQKEDGSLDAGIHFIYDLLKNKDA